MYKLFHLPFAAVLTLILVLPGLTQDRKEKGDTRQTDALEGPLFSFALVGNTFRLEDRIKCRFKLTNVIQDPIRIHT